jgi:formylglycine-generating enzyme required for sulfatase activity
MGPDPYDVWHPESHEVKISKPYFMSATEVTNAQFKMFAPDFEPCRLSAHEEAPATRVTWEQADSFCRWLSEKEGAKYRLATEAEWEYACRAGSKTPYCFGEDTRRLAEYAWWGRSNSSAARVAIFRPNAWGLYDMHCNALEWVSDWFAHAEPCRPECPDQGTVVDPTGPDTGKTHVIKSGPWIAQYPEQCACTVRHPLPRFDRRPFAGKETPGFREMLGFRIVREVAE